MTHEKRKTHEMTRDLKWLIQTPSHEIVLVNSRVRFTKAELEVQKV